MITNSLLTSLGCSPKLAIKYQPHLALLAESYGVNTPLRVSHFLAQILHESGRLSHVREIWGPTAQQKRYERDFKKPWDKIQKAFDLGNYLKGDGFRFRGRALVQVTGRFNYQAFSRYCGVDYVKNPEYLERPYDACLAAFWFWETRNLNRQADLDNRSYNSKTKINRAVSFITRTVNGGQNGLKERSEIYEKCYSLLSKQLL